MHRHRHGDSGALAISFANITQFSHKACHWLMHNESQLCVSRSKPIGAPGATGVAPRRSETLHVQDGRSPLVSPSNPNPQSEARGEAWWDSLVRTWIFNLLQVRPRCPPEFRASAARRGLQISMQGWDLLLFGSYHRGGLDVSVLTDVARATHATASCRSCSSATSTTRRRRSRNWAGSIG